MIGTIQFVPQAQYNAVIWLAVLVKANAFICVTYITTLRHVALLTNKMQALLEIINIEQEFYYCIYIHCLSDTDTLFNLLNKILLN